MLPENRSEQIMGGRPELREKILQQVAKRMKAEVLPEHKTTDRANAHQFGHLITRHQRLGEGMHITCWQYR